MAISFSKIRTKLYHMGIRGKVSRNTLVDAKEARDWRIYADFAQVLIHTARRLYINTELGVELDHIVNEIPRIILIITTKKIMSIRNQRS